MKKHNFYAGPSILNQGVIKNAADAVMNFAGTSRYPRRIRSYLPRWWCKPPILHGTS